MFTCICCLTWDIFVATVHCCTLDYCGVKCYLISAENWLCDRERRCNFFGCRMVGAVYWLTHNFSNHLRLCIVCLSQCLSVGFIPGSYPPNHKISRKSVHNFWIILLTHRETLRQTQKQTNTQRQNPLDSPTEPDLGMDIGSVFPLFQHWKIGVLGH